MEFNRLFVCTEEELLDEIFEVREQKKIKYEDARMTKAVESHYFTTRQIYKQRFGRTVKTVVSQLELTEIKDVVERQFNQGGYVDATTHNRVMNFFDKLLAEVE